MYAVEFLQLCVYVTCGHATRIQRQDFFIEAFQAGLALFDELRFKCALPVTWYPDFHVPLLSFQRFLTLSIAHIPAGVPLAHMFWVPQMRVEFRFQASFID